MKRKICLFPIGGLLIILAILNLTGCEKFLDEKPDQKLATVETLEDMQGLLDYYLRVNYKDPAADNICADDYFLTDAVYNARDEYDRNLYMRRGSKVFSLKNNAWQDAYYVVNICNTVLDEVDKKRGKGVDAVSLDFISAQAKFLRARTFLNIINVWTLAYQPSSSDTDLGIPLRLKADFNAQTTRASVAESYRQVIADLREVLPKLPAKASTPVRASKAAAYGILSRVMLQLHDYTTAGKYADSCLQIHTELMDFNKLSTSASFPILQLNAEVIFESRASGAGPLSQTRALINPELYGLYENDDLRKTIFFKPSGTDFIFKGYYAGTTGYFNGIATDELLLTRAECHVRNGKINEALADLNLLLKNRYKTGKFTPLQLNDARLLLARIKIERRKELVFRSVRWTDIKRWNAEGDGIVLSRTAGGETITLLPNSLNYALAIPEDIISLAGISQNLR